MHGTTGYEFGAMVNNLFVDGRNERTFDDIYARFIRERRGRITFRRSRLSKQEAGAA